MKNNEKLIIGLGKTGLSCVRYLAKKGYNLAVADTRLNPPELTALKKEFPKIPIHLGKLTEEILTNAQEIIVSPGVAISDPTIQKCINNNISVIGDIELFVNEVRQPIAAITGSNGKSTVATLLGEIIQHSGKKVGIGGNLGTPALELIDQKNECYVLELSSFQLETTPSLKAKVATVLNVSPDHMDRYPNFEEYIKAKQKIYNNAEISIINRDDPLSYTGANLSNKIISFGTDPASLGNFGLDNGYLMFGEQRLLPIEKLKLKGTHNISNILAALAIGKALEVPLNRMVETIQNFSGLPHRCQLVSTIDNVDWYNDSKATNVGAAKAAIEGLGTSIKGKIILIAGGLSKEANFSSLQDSIIKHVKTVILIGQDADLIARGLTNKVKTIKAESMKEAVMLSAKQAEPEDIVLLAPACASFDMFDNFEHRGAVFTSTIKNYFKIS